jgi:hypothetical protein
LLSLLLKLSLLLSFFFDVVLELLGVELETREKWMVFVLIGSELDLFFIF